MGVYLCPVCLGKGIVANGFYRSIGQTWVSSSTTPEECRGCYGKGWVVVNDAAPLLGDDLLG